MPDDPNNVLTNFTSLLSLGTQLQFASVPDTRNIHANQDNVPDSIYRYDAYDQLAPSVTIHTGWFVRNTGTYQLGEAYNYLPSRTEVAPAFSQTNIIGGFRITGEQPYKVDLSPWGLHDGQGALLS